MRSRALVVGALRAKGKLHCRKLSRRGMCGIVLSHRVAVHTRASASVSLGVWMRRMGRFPSMFEFGVLVLVVRFISRDWRAELSPSKARTFRCIHLVYQPCQVTPS